MNLNGKEKHHHHHHHNKVTAKSADAVADEVLGQLGSLRYKSKDDKGGDEKGGETALDKVNVGELSCRARTATNVGLDYLVNH